MKTFKFLIALLALSLSLNAVAATRYVSDNVVMYLHSGPSSDYRIISAIKVGTAVTTLQYNQNTKFMKVKTATGKIGWAQNKLLQDTLPANILLPKVQTSLKKTQQQLQEKIQSLSEKDNLIEELQSDKIDLQQTINTLKTRNLELDLLQDTKEERVKMEWMMYGGSVLFFGLLLGLIIPFLPRRKKRNDNW